MSFIAKSYSGCKLSKIEFLSVKEIKLFVPRLMDAAQLNPQNNNARMILKHWELQSARVATLCYDEPDEQVDNHPKIRVVRLWRRHAWYVHLFLRYIRNYDLIFYPGPHAVDIAGLLWRKRLGLRTPLIATLEGLVGDAERERFYSEIAGHPVYCQRVDASRLKRVDAILEMADHIIAISPFLARMGRRRYGNKFSMLPLGIDRTIFYPPSYRKLNPKPVVVCAARVAPHKRPEIFLKLAEKFSQARFRWFGDGEKRRELVSEISDKGLYNIDFPGSLLPNQLAHEFRNADIFLLPSYAEGVPKVTQEAAACGLPIILFGFYESPSVVNRDNGFVVWTDEEMEARVDTLITDVGIRNRMGTRGLEMARGWDWQILSPQWERQVFSTTQNIK